ncbi:hypothetical protein S40285_10554 [Stachybotrys chlorohalonatus IBT 40285]|uniref:Uncharacterized protein n=1 Tax=Stachybotrys chlorohalonatus (strain IBT 40285) TaxID=1283841 RepID=A0A084Q9G6_STAC4|nr:hypothetical protein S40285_10554 [Stachybotrys chlorohalonata IBT 40285]
MPATQRAGNSSNSTHLQAVAMRTAQTLEVGACRQATVESAYGHLGCTRACLDCGAWSTVHWMMIKGLIRRRLCRSRIIASTYGYDLPSLVLFESYAITTVAAVADGHRPDDSISLLVRATSSPVLTSTRATST